MRSRTVALFVAGCLTLAVHGSGAASSRAGADPWTRLSRPLHLPTLGRGDACPVTPARRVSSAFGRVPGPGPVHPVGDPRFGVPFVYPPERGTVWYPTRWSGQKVLWIGHPRYTGPVLIRGHRLDGPEGLGFGEGHVPAREMRLTTSQASHSGWRGRMWPSYTRLRAPGCYAWQVDGTSFSTVIVFRAVLARR